MFTNPLRRAPKPGPMSRLGRGSRIAGWVYALATLSAAGPLISPSPIRAEGGPRDVPNNSFGEGPELQFEPPPLIDDARPVHIGRAVFLTAGILAGASIWYWRDLEFNSRDWDLRWDGDSWKRKATLQSLRFDQNLFHTNAVSHGRAGVAHYHVARGNGFGLGTSLAVTAGTSVFWEAVVEFKEQPSLNDLVVNTTTGLSVGEPFYQLGEFFMRSRPTLLNRGLAVVLSPVGSVNDLIDRRRRTPEAVDALGFTREVAHRFQLAASYDVSTYDESTERHETSLSAATELVTLPGYGLAGRFNRYITPASWTSIAAQLELDKRGISGGALLTRLALFGHYSQNFRQTPNGIAGTGALLGLGSAFHYEDRGRPGADDYSAVMNIAGPIFEFVARTHGIRVRLSGELYGDFAMVKSLAFEGRLPPMTGNVFHPRDYGGRIPGVLGARGYYYALGVTAGTRLEVEGYGWDLGADLRSDHFDSISGFDRFQEQLVDEYELVDQRTVARSWIGLRPWILGPRVFAAVEWRRRRGKAEGVVGEYRDLRVQMGAAFRF
jgi:hypothetical protein